MTTLNISPDLSMPLDAVTRTFGILANRGAGKTTAASVMAEEMLKSRLPIVVIDPTGVWWGLRLAADGRSEGYPITILGGEHGDLPLTEDMGERVAEVVARERVSLILDISEMLESEQFRFLTAFAKRLYHVNRQPLHVFMDECHTYLPQRPMREQNHLLHAMKKIVQMGRVRGLGMTMISQRSAVVNKDVLELVDTLIVLRTIGINDREALLRWVTSRASAEQIAAFSESLSALKTGEAWVWSPEWLGCFERVQIRFRETFDSSATPKIGEDVLTPKITSILDADHLAQLLEVPALPVGDVAALQEEVLRLRAEVKQKTRVVERVEVPVERVVEVPAIPDEQRAELIERIETLRAISAKLVERLSSVGHPPALAGTDVLDPILPVVHRYNQIIQAQLETTSAPPLPADSLSTAARRMLETALRYYPMWLKRNQLALLASYSPKSSSVAASVKELRERDLLAAWNGMLRPTDSAFLLLGASKPKAASAAQYRRDWLSVLPTAESRLLAALIKVYPQSISKEELAYTTGYSLTSSGFSGALSMLAQQDLIERGKGFYRADPHLFKEN